MTDDFFPPRRVRAMDMCCSTIGNETSYPQLEPDCYVWCAVNLVRVPGQDALAATHAAFLRCLQTGKDAENVQLSCGLGTGASSGSRNPTTITSPTSSVSWTGGATGSTAATTTTTASSTNAASSSVPPAAQTTTTRPSQAGLGAVRHGSLAILGLWILQGVLAGAL
ncbi:uncharacterized protein K489DRAFT_381516 [Dissoconium aciculare CBS 342.82]|uniref:Uncharacterized protein n=1 Tax=Dissoconium aciculare CBS 342.82 TaxID=1314786 RepID=A0A6J3M0F9_9PEZI|nr:uncharacterized protein K489DRAFT_381516 [Dissoconium aciculare CBS 342.82]KAF1821520.1 hypothetical protein K489DRAFT_381516 [Dissoconium aciculare CBS 342.82]